MSVPTVGDQVMEGNICQFFNKLHVVVIWCNCLSYLALSYLFGEHAHIGALHSVSLSHVHFHKIIPRSVEKKSGEIFDAAEG